MRQKGFENYHIEESSSTFTIRPFYSYRKKQKWYWLVILVAACLCVYFYKLDYEGALILCTAVLILTTYWLLEMIFFEIPQKYSFDKASKAVYRSTIFSKNKKIMDLSEVVIFRNTEVDHWQYRLGRRKFQFVKSYPISLFFKDNVNDEDLFFYEQEILSKIESMIHDSV